MFLFFLFICMYVIIYLYVVIIVVGGVVGVPIPFYIFLFYVPPIPPLEKFSPIENLPMGFAIRDLISIIFFEKIKLHIIF